MFRTGTNWCDDNTATVHIEYHSPFSIHVEFHNACNSFREPRLEEPAPHGLMLEILLKKVIVSCVFVQDKVACESMRKC